MDNASKSITAGVFSKAITAYEQSKDDDGYHVLQTTTGEEDVIRQEYLSALKPLENARREATYRYNHDTLEDLDCEQLNRFHKGFLETREQFMAMIEEIKSHLPVNGRVDRDKEDNGGEHAVAQQGLVIMTSDGQVHQFPAEQELIMVGAIPFNDLVLPGAFGVDGISRLHVVIARIRGNLVAMDLGSHYGISACSRSKHTRELPVSRRGARKPLIFDSDETIVLRLGPHKRITIAPKDCTTCSDQPRQVVFTPCNHFIMCRDCAQEWMSRSDRCPVCRAHVSIKAQPADGCDHHNYDSVAQYAMSHVGQVSAVMPYEIKNG